MQTTQYLYNKSPNELPSLVEGFTARYHAAKDVLNEILATPLESRDMYRQSEVSKAIDFCRSFMDGNAWT